MADRGTHVPHVRRRSTHPLVPTDRATASEEAVGDPELGPPQRASTAGSVKRVRNLIARRLLLKESVDDVSIPDTVFSEAFEETAIWDQKAILSLGTSLIYASSLSF